jgi:hypothetical protein
VRGARCDPAPIADATDAIQACDHGLGVHRAASSIRRTRAIEMLTMYHRKHITVRGA